MFGAGRHNSGSDGDPGFSIFFGRTAPGASAGPKDGGVALCCFELLEADKPGRRLGSTRPPLFGKQMKATLAVSSASSAVQASRGPSAGRNKSQQESERSTVASQQPAGSSGRYHRDVPSNDGLRPSLRLRPSAGHRCPRATGFRRLHRSPGSKSRRKSRPPSSRGFLQPVAHVTDRKITPS